MLNLNRLRLLHELAMLGSITAVAHALKLTRPAVSQQIALLEKEIGEPLVERTSSGVTLTNTGKSLALRAAKVFGLVEELEIELASKHQHISGEVRVSALGSLATSLVPEAFAQLQATHPLIDLTFVEHESNAGLRAVVSREVDLALIDEWADIKRPPRDIEFIQLGTDRFLAVLSAQHRLANRKSLQLQDLQRERWVLNQAAPTARANVIRACQGAGFTPIEAANCNSGVAMIEFVRVTGMVAVYPARGLQPFRQLGGVKFVELAPPIKRNIRAALLPGALGRPAVRATVDVLRALTKTATA